MDLAFEEKYTWTDLVILILSTRYFENAYNFAINHFVRDSMISSLNPHENCEESCA